MQTGSRVKLKQKPPIETKEQIQWLEGDEIDPNKIYIVNQVSGKSIMVHNAYIGYWHKINLFDEIV